MTEKNDSNIKKEMPDLPDSVVGLNGSVLPEDIENLNLEDDSKPWNKQFEDDLDDKGQRSRVAKNKKKRGVRTLVFALFAALILLMCAPVVNWAMNRNSNPNSNGDKIVANADSKKKSDDADKKKKKEDSKKKDSKKESDKKKSTNKSESTNNSSEDTNTNTNTNANEAAQKAAADAKAKATAQAQQKAAEEQAAADAKAKKAAEDAEAAKKSSSDSTGYYTVGSGDNPFRIAYNHNMTTDELYALNGLQPGSVLKPGMRLRVK